MFYYVHEKLQFSNSEVIVTLIVILFLVSVCMNIPLITQDDHKNRFKIKASLCLSIPILA